MTAILNAGQHVTLHVSLGSVSSKRQDWTLYLISDAHQASTAVWLRDMCNTEDKLQAKRSSPSGKDLSNNILTAIANAIDNNGLVAYCICYSCQALVSHRLHAACLKAFEAAVSVAVHLDPPRWLSDIGTCSAI